MTDNEKANLAEQSARRAVNLLAEQSAEQKAVARAWAEARWVPGTAAAKGNTPTDLTSDAAITLRWIEDGDDPEYHATTVWDLAREALPTASRAKSEAATMAELWAEANNGSDQAWRAIKAREDAESAEREAEARRAQARIAEALAEEARDDAETQTELVQRARFTRNAEQAEELNARLAEEARKREFRKRAEEAAERAEGEAEAARKAAERARDESNTAFEHADGSGSEEAEEASVEAGRHADEAEADADDAEEQADEARKCARRAAESEDEAELKELAADAEDHATGAEDFRANAEWSRQSAEDEADHARVAAEMAREEAEAEQN